MIRLQRDLPLSLESFFAGLRDFVFVINKTLDQSSTTGLFVRAIFLDIISTRFSRVPIAGFHIVVFFFARRCQIGFVAAEAFDQSRPLFHGRAMSFDIFFAGAFVSTLNGERREDRKKNWNENAHVCSPWFYFEPA
jgi:hypothetical protein